MKEPALGLCLAHRKSDDLTQQTDMCLCVEGSDELLIEMNVLYSVLSHFKWKLYVN